jgi:penicillin-insensitive murein endopeptidase
VGPLAAGPTRALSLGHAAGGGLLRGVKVAPEGDGYFVPAAWRPRRAVYATPALAGALARAFAAVSVLHPGGRAPLGDLSRRGGGPADGHRSHQSGRDADIFFYALDAQGRSFQPARALFRYGADGKAVAWSPPHGQPVPRLPLPRVRLDLPRTWALVRALLTDPAIEVQWIFVSLPVRALLLEHAARVAEDVALVGKAEVLLRQPGEAAPHDDHMHVRVFCDPEDRAFGCDDGLPVRWLKKRWKYMTPALPEPARSPADEPRVAVLPRAPSMGDLAASAD